MNKVLPNLNDEVGDIVIRNTSIFGRHSCHVFLK
jgi:hypothetical protein